MNAPGRDKTENKSYMYVIEWIKLRGGGWPENRMWFLEEIE